VAQLWRGHAGHECAYPFGNGLALKMDERAGRVFVERGDADCYFASGWELRNESEFAAIKQRLADLGVPFHAATAEELALRHVFDMVWFRDPSGNRHELSYGYGPGLTGSNLRQGCPALSLAIWALATWCCLHRKSTQPAPLCWMCWAFGLSDILIHRPAPGVEQRIDFIHCANGRHHSLALFEGAVPSGCVHLMVEVATPG
jgi:3,4-dihydroxy-9,10-secoandrosta-1,3,5(10)-triene-9,17-dione 4,5-dioxygenase